MELSSTNQISRAVRTTHTSYRLILNLTPLIFLIIGVSGIGIIPSITLAQDAKLGTAIAAIRTPNEIVVAADSKAVHENNLSDPNPFCKIKQIDNVFVTAYGLYKESRSGFDMWSIISEASQGSGNISDKIKSFETRVNAPLTIALMEIKRNKPNEYQKKYVERNPAGVIFFGIENDILVFHHHKLVAIDTGIPWLTVIREDCPGLNCPDGIMSVFVGMNPRDMEEYIKANYPWDMKSDVIDIAHKFVQREIDRGGIEFGPPIDILRITKEGPEWIKQKPECQ